LHACVMRSFKDWLSAFIDSIYGYGYAHD
jgi:hypothetical protein